MFDVLTPPDPGASYLVPRSERPYLDAVTDPVRRLRIGFTHASPQGTAVDPEAVRAVEQAAALLESSGHIVEPAAPDVDGQRLGMDFMTVWTAWCAAELVEACRETGASTTAFDIDTQMLAAAGRAVPSPELLLAHVRWTEYTRALGDFHETYDLLLTPTVAGPPLRIGQNRTPAIADTVVPPLLRLGAGRILSRTGAYRDTVAANLSAVPFTQLANVTGRPAMSVPTHWTADGLPLGTQFVGRPGSEYLLLQLAAEIETAQPWFDRVPPESGLAVPSVAAGRTRW